MRVRADGTTYLFASGFLSVIQSDALEFSPDGSALYVADYFGNTVYRISRSGPAISISSPADASQLAANTMLLVTGQAQAFGNANSIRLVTIDGVPVETLDTGGNFFTRVTLASGQNLFEFVATDSFGQTATTTLTLFGVEASRGRSISQTSPKSPRASSANLATRRSTKRPARSLPIYQCATRGNIQCALPCWSASPVSAIPPCACSIPTA